MKSIEHVILFFLGFRFFPKLRNFISEDVRLNILFTVVLKLDSIVYTNNLKPVLYSKVISFPGEINVI